jgi:hypothetical protein
MIVERVDQGFKPVMSARNGTDVELAMGVRENEWGVALQDKVNPYEFIVWDNGRVNLEINRDKVLGEYEFQGMLAMADLFRGGCDWVEWISPPGGISDYPATRICLLKGEAIEGGVKFKGWGICSEHTASQCMQIVRQQMKHGADIPGLVFSFDDLRKTPLGFKQNDGEVLALMKETVDLPEVWESIENGLAEQGLMEDVVMVREILRGLEPEVRARMDDFTFQYWFEIKLAQRGRFLGQGAHGGSVMGGGLMSSSSGFFDSMFSAVDVIDARLEKCERCQNYFMRKRGSCPNCNHD